MGWLDHSTNNIILDAVLTDYGRQQLSRADGRFSIESFALSDDEVDYKMIKKYGRAVGKEKIEKNTPIFEALTNPSIAMKYMLIAAENSSAISAPYLPYLVAGSSSAALTKNTTNVPISVTLYYRSTTTIPTSYIQNTYTIKVPDRFLYLSNGQGGTLSASNTASSTVNPGDPNRIAVYKFKPNQSVTTILFTVNAKSIDNTMLSVYGSRTGSGNERKINTYITVIGDTTGPTINIPITYTASPA